MKKIIFSILAALVFCSFNADATTWSKYRIMLDPGHGGTDPGASGPTKPHEAELALACAQKLNTFITSNLGGTVKMTRTSNTTVSLTARKSASISYDPYIFCSIHLNAFNGTANGTETWYYHSTGNSLNLANRVHATLISQMNRSNRGVKQNGWTVITGSPSIPAILTEGLFVDNKTEHDLIKDKSGAGFLKWVRGHLYGFYNHLKTFDSTITDPKTVAAISGSSSAVTTPTLKASPTSITSEVTYTGAGVNSTITFDLSGSNLAADVTLSSNNANFKLEKTSFTKAKVNSGTDVNVIWTPSGIGTETATITAKYTSGSTTLTATVKITGNAVAPPLKLKQVWAFSEYNGKATSKGWDATKVRNLTYYQGKLYMVYNQKEIKVVNAQTGEDLGSLSTKGLSGGVLTLVDVRVFKGKVYACNLGKPAVKDAAGNVTEAAVPLKIYRWNDDHSDPEVVLSTTSMNSAARVGDCMTFSGDLTSGKVVFANDNGSKTLILLYPIENGTFGKTPTVVNVKKTDGSQLKTGASTRAYATSDNTYWITGQHAYTNLINSDGTQSYFIDGNETWGNEFARFKYNSTTLNYALETVYSEIDGKNYLKGQMRLLQKGATWKESKVVQTIPANGLSQTVSNTSCASSIATSSTTSGDLNTIEAWMSINEQGVCYYISSDGKAPTYNVEPIGPAEDPAPSITVGSSLSIPETYIGEKATAKFTVKGENLVNDITLTLTDAANVFTITPVTIAKGTGSVSTSVTVTYSPLAAGNHSGTIKITTKKADGTTVAKSVAISASAIEKTIINSDVNLKADWVYSQTAGTLSAAPWFSAASPLTRSVAATETKAYILTSHPFNTKPVLNIIDANSGASKGTVNLDGVTGGQNILAAVEIFDGVLIGSNSARTTDALKVYKWSSDATAPTVLINDATHGGILAGDNLSVSGTMADGKIWVSDGSKLLYYTVKNGVASQTPTAISLTKSGAAYSVGSIKGNVEVMPQADGTIWVVGKDKHPTLFSASGEYISELSNSHIQGSIHGSAGKIFTFGDKLYGAFATYTQPDAQTLSGGALSLVDLSGDTPVHKSIQPASGLGTTRNTDFQSSVSHVIYDKGSKLNLYLVVPFQGVAKYSYDGATTGVGSVGSAENGISIEGGRIISTGGEIAEVQVYNTAGVLVLTSNSVSTDISGLGAGVYIVRAIFADGKVISDKIVR